MYTVHCTVQYTFYSMYSVQCIQVRYRKGAYRGGN